MIYEVFLRGLPGEVLWFSTDVIAIQKPATYDSIASCGKRWDWGWLWDSVSIETTSRTGAQKWNHRSTLTICRVAKIELIYWYRVRKPLVGLTPALRIRKVLFKWLLMFAANCQGGNRFYQIYFLAKLCFYFLFKQYRLSVFALRAQKVLS